MNSASDTRRCFLLLLIFAALISFTGLACREIASGDESRVAGISAEMFLESDYRVPRLNGRPFLEYPGLYYYAQCASFRLFGITDRAAKLPSALCMFGASLLTFLLMLRLKRSTPAAMLSSVFLLTCAQFWANGRICMVDIMLTFFVLVSVYGFVSWNAHRRKFLWFLLFISGMCGGVMTKGLIGILFPLAICGTWSLVSDILNRRIDFLRYVVLVCGFLLSLLPAGVWYWLLYARDGWDAFYTACWTNNFGRFSGAVSDHAVPFYYYLKRLPEWFQPYLILLPFGIWFAVRQVKRERNLNLLLSLCYLAVPYILLTIASNKRQVYLLPLTVPAACLCGEFAAAAFADARVKRFVPYIRPVLTAAVMVFAVVLLILAPGWLRVYPLTALVAGALSLLPRMRGSSALALFLASLALTFTSIDAGIFARRNAKTSLRPLFEYCLEQEAQGKKVYILSRVERLEGGAYYYMHRNMPVRRKGDSFDAERELWIIRDKKLKTGKAFGDSFFVVPPSAELLEKYSD